MSSEKAAVIITGGGGFLGQCLAVSLLQKGSLMYDVVVESITTNNNNDNDTSHSSQKEIPIDTIFLGDIVFPPEGSLQTDSASNPNNIVIHKVPGDVSQMEYCEQLYKQVQSFSYVSVFHLGAVMSGDGERDFDLCMRVNLHGFMNMIECARQHKTTTDNSTATTNIKFIFASAGATIGSGAPTDYITKDDVIQDSVRATPHTTYGMTKACCELLLSDYTRRGFLNSGVGVRLPTIVVRAGKPNAATTSCFSGVIREPLSGMDVTLPIASTVQHAMTSKRAAIQAMLIVHDTPKTTLDQVLGYDRTIFLPSIPLSLGQLQQALLNVVTTHDKLGKITYQVDEFLSDVVGSFPTKINASRALELGIPPAPDAETLVREYMEDFPNVLVDGLEIKPVDMPSTATTTTSSINHENKVAVITGAGSGIGQAVAQRLVQGGGWTVVLAGRRLSALEETQKLINNDEHCHVVVTDVTVETDVIHLFQTTNEKFGRIDLLFNNAGIARGGPLETLTLSDFETVMKTNVTGSFLCAREAFKHMMKKSGGRIINNGSISAQTPRPNSVPYTTAKHAINGLTKVIALDGRQYKIACGQVDFGNVVSEISMATNQAGRGALQANGTYLQEPSMSLTDAADSVATMANLPLEANILHMTVMATSMPFVGRG